MLASRFCFRMFKFGLLIMPFSILLLILRNPGPVRLYLRAGATSPERARTPGGLRVKGPYLIRDAVRRGELVEVGDGRYYVDLARYRRRRRRLIAGLTVAAAGVSVAVYMMWPILIDAASSSDQNFG